MSLRRPSPSRGVVATSCRQCRRRASGSSARPGSWSPTSGGASSARVAWTIGWRANPWRRRPLTPGQLAWFALECPEEALTVDVWVGDDLIRRIQVVSDVDAGATGSGAMTTTTEFYDFGATVTIGPPG